MTEITEDDIIIDKWDKQLKWYQIIILKKRKDNGWDGYTKKEADKVKQQILQALEKAKKFEEKK